MKKYSNNQALIKGCRQLLVCAAFSVLINFLPSHVFAQADSAKTTADTTVAATEPSLLSPSLELLSIQKADSSVDLKVALKTKFKGSTIKLPLLKVTFYQVADTVNKEMGFIITDLNGKGVFNCKANQVLVDKDGKVHFKAMFAGNKSMEATDGEVTAKRARIDITPIKEDSVTSVKVKLIDVGTGKEAGVSNIVVGIFVKRQFFPMKLGEVTTDTTGEGTLEIPKGLPGDANGNITLIAKIDENETYGNLESSTSQNWGVAVSDANSVMPRALWSSHPPVWMVITFVILVATVWGHYFVIVFELLRLRKEEPHEPNNPINV